MTTSMWSEEAVQAAATTQGNLAPARYCLATCYCGQCDHWKPLPTPRATAAPVIDKRINKTWTERPESN